MSRFQPQQPPNASKGPQFFTDRVSRATEVRLINGEENSIVPRTEAERLANETGLDLIVVSLDSNPPVIRLVDYGKFKFEAEKKAREAKKKQHVVEIKEVKCGIRIDQHDFKVKVHNAQRFLYEANKVKITIRLKGREVQHTNLAFDLANKFVLELQEYGTLEGNLRLEGRNLTINLQPNKQAPKPLALGEKPPDAQDENPQVGS